MIKSHLRIFTKTEIVIKKIEDGERLFILRDLLHLRLWQFPAYLLPAF